MKPSVFLLWTVFILTSCATSNRIIEKDDSYKEIQSIWLTQSPNAIPIEEPGRLSVRQHYPFTSVYLFEEKNTKRPVMSLGIRITAPVGSEALDSVMFLSLDDERIRIVSAEYKSTAENNSYQLMNRQFSVPENLWVSVVHSQKIGYQLYLGKDEIDVKLNATETAKLKEFFSRAVQRRDATIPTLPPGKVKW